MQPHFYKVYSRLGLINLPNHGHTPNVGVEDGPDAVLTDAFLSSFPKETAVDSFSFPLPEAIDKKSYLAEMAAHSLKLANLINKTLQPGETQVVVGGDHSVAFGSLLALIRRVDPKRIGYIQFDSHGDVHRYSTSPSGNFHGMWLRPFIDPFDASEISRLVDGYLGKGQLMFVGNLELESEEENVFKDNKIEVVPSEEILESKDSALARIKEYASSFDHIHISFDVDVFDRQLVSATGTPAQHGMTKPQVFEILEVLKPLPTKSIDVVEVNPRKAGSTATIEIAQEVLSNLLS